LINNEKQQFKEMLDTLFEIYNRRHADQNLLRVWWQMLEKYPMKIVSQSFNKWTSENNKCPTPHDIIVFCRSKNQELIAAQQPKLAKPKPMSKENREKISKKIQELVGNMTRKQL
jgi:hypothetical protein